MAYSKRLLIIHASVASWVSLVSESRSRVAMCTDYLLVVHGWWCLIFNHELRLLKHLFLNVLLGLNLAWLSRRLVHDHLLLGGLWGLHGFKGLTLSLWLPLAGVPPLISRWCWLQKLHDFLLLFLLIKQAWQMHLLFLFDLLFDHVMGGVIDWVIWPRLLWSPTWNDTDGVWVAWSVAALDVLLSV